MTNPTIKKSRKVESEEHAELIQKLNDLEQAWKSLEKPRPRKSSTPSSHHHHLLQTSPRTLMSSLQQRKPRLTNCSDAVEEILMDRRVAISSGRFKGRQLFGEMEITCVEESYSSDWMNGVAEREVMMNYGNNDERRQVQRHEIPFPEEEKKVVEITNAAEKSGGDGKHKDKGGGCLLATVCLAIILVVIVIAFFCLSCKGSCVEELTLVPT